MTCGQTGNGHSDSSSCFPVTACSCQESIVRAESDSSDMAQSANYFTVRKIGNPTGRKRQSGIQGLDAFKGRMQFNGLQGKQQTEFNPIGPLHTGIAGLGGQTAGQGDAALSFGFLFLLNGFFFAHKCKACLLACNICGPNRTEQQYRKHYNGRGSTGHQSDRCLRYASDQYCVQTGRCEAQSHTCPDHQ